LTEDAPEAFTAVGIPARVVNPNDRHGAEEGEFEPANLPVIGAIPRGFLVEDNQEEMDGCCVDVDRYIAFRMGSRACGRGHEGEDAKPTHRMAGLNTKEDIVRAYPELTYVPEFVYRGAARGVFVHKLVDGIIIGGPRCIGEYLKWACRAGLDVSVIRGLAEEVDPHPEWEGYINEATRCAAVVGGQSHRPGLLPVPSDSGVASFFSK